VKVENLLVAHGGLFNSVAGWRANAQIKLNGSKSVRSCSLEVGGYSAGNFCRTWSPWRTMDFFHDAAPT